MGRAAKLGRFLRRKFGVGLVSALGAEGAAREVLGTWEEEKNKNKNEWVSNYSEGLDRADIDTGTELLAEWYNILESRIAPRLREVVAKVYAEAKSEYKARKTSVIRAKKGAAIGRAIEIVV